MTKVGDITINLSFDDKSKLRLRAIAKHVGALAEELDRIDNLEPCKECGSLNCSRSELFDGDELLSGCIECRDCGAKYDDELPTQLNKLKETTLSIGIANSKSAEVIADALKDFPIRLEGGE